VVKGLFLNGIKVNTRYHAVIGAKKLTLVIEPDSAYSGFSLLDMASMGA